MRDWNAAADQVVARCRRIATYSEEPGATTRTFLSPPMHDVHRDLSSWLERAGATVWVDAVGNLRGLYGDAAAPRLLIVSHLDTVPNAGAFDGILGVVMGVALLESLGRRATPVAIEVIGFSEEEGVRYSAPFLGSRAVAGTLDAALLERIAPQIRAFGLDSSGVADARLARNTIGSLEFHIEQGPVLEQLDFSVGVVEAIAGQSRLEFRFEGAAAHAGTTPAAFRRDALAAAVEWMALVETRMRNMPGLMATVGRLTVEPGASNVIPATATATLDIRHAGDAIRETALRGLMEEARLIARRRKLNVAITLQSEAPATPMDRALTAMLEDAVRSTGHLVYRMTSGAGHDSMILAPLVPATMLFLRSPGGISHSPAEDVRAGDVATALACGADFLERIFAGRPHVFAERPHA